ncbi:O-antigen/teichoic acid export membrane protein [Flavobacterium sp. 7E]|uniref:lipopolysaccharide biosynthesis protein n=1 Tax=Flavobacterium sp. 7E TaxID=2735898 RepID=UPI00156E9A48|nr:polysaccharide biosynthesis protein [Flavobacterium sp. 7E]NRS90161.1 O-antigen/teichoic acid export membrane protein [Flavobacterium sp. 7E]
MKQFLKIYLWQFISILFNFAAIFVVTPYLSANQTIYGIYTLIIAAYMFLSYADFGFLGAGIKFASECYAQKNLKQEIKIIGFTGFIFLIFVVIYALGILYISFKPEMLVKNLANNEEREIASNLLLILALFCPVFVMQRIVQIIFAVRLRDYVFQRIFICANAVKIIYAIIFFSNENYPIVSYFLFSQLCTLTAVLLGLYLAKKKFGYDFRLFFGAFKFSKEIYEKTKKLAFVSIFLTLCWILYYELDPFVISKLLGANHLAIFAIGFTLMEYFRGVFGIVFGPFTAKFNHFVGLKDFEGLHSFFSRVLILALPLTVFPVLSISITIKNFIFCWVGDQYADSVPIAQVLVLSFLFSFLSSPTGILIMAYERAKLLYFTNALLPIIYWIGIFLTFKYIGLQAFADFKAAAFFVVAIVYFNIIVKLLNLKFWPYLWKLISPSILPIVFIVVFTFLTRSYLPMQKDKVNLLIYFAYNGIVIGSAFVIYYFSCPEYKKSIDSIAGPILGKFFKRDTIKI